MNVLKAARETMNLWKSSTSIGLDVKPSITYNHCYEMLKTLLTHKEFSYGKQCHWLGWMQASCVASTDLSLEDMKQINLRNRDDQ